uniref:Macaca fascicularis brain cDNA, clone: QmoA-11050 n=1 Tax=Macaca fascicularis TaxID=9541 RepID=I7G878_MACFA|nr:unnamed protein product [Macaca fascicularis]
MVSTAQHSTSPQASMDSTLLSDPHSSLLASSANYYITSHRAITSASKLPLGTDTS